LGDKYERLQNEVFIF